jgi:outer membrane immunogenic protein
MRIARLVGLVAFSFAVWATAPVAAADRPIFKPTIVDNPIWSGVYGGVHIGHGTTSDSATYVAETAPPGAFAIPLGTNAKADNSGLIVGFQLGYNYQVSRWVFGIEGDFTWTDASISKTLVGTLNTPSSVLLTAHQHWFSTLTGRAGIAAGDWLFYAKIGGAWTRATYGGSATVGGVTNPRADLSPTRSGWTAGLGAEWKFRRDLSARLEYDYLDFGTIRLTPASALGFLSTFDIETDVHLVKFGLNYHFGAP